MAIDPNRKPPSQTRRSLRSRSGRRGARRASSDGSLRGLRGRVADADGGRLELLMLRLRVVFGTAITAELALRQQGAERDVEIADCLRAGVSEPLVGSIEQLAGLGRRERRMMADSERRDRSRGRSGANRLRRAALL